jgi:hypothetical protein
VSERERKSGGKDRAQQQGPADEGARHTAQEKKRQHLILEARKYNDAHPDLVDQFHSYTFGECLAGMGTSVLAVRRWQHEHGLHVDGKVGPLTVAAARRTLEKKPETVANAEPAGGAQHGGAKPAHREAVHPATNTVKPKPTPRLQVEPIDHPANKELFEHAASHAATASVPQAGAQKAANQEQGPKSPVYDPKHLPYEEMAVLPANDEFFLEGSQWSWVWTGLDEILKTMPNDPECLHLYGYALAIEFLSINIKVKSHFTPDQRKAVQLGTRDGAALRNGNAALAKELLAKYKGNGELAVPAVRFAMAKARPELGSPDVSFFS